MMRPRMQAFRAKITLCLALVALAGCTNLQSPANDQPATLMLPAALAGIKDARPRFRQLFCSAVHRDLLQTAPDCSDRLIRLSDENTSSDATPAPRISSNNVELLIIPGIFGECVRNIVSVFGDALPHLSQLGFTASTIPVHGRASAEANAIVIRDHIAARSMANPEKRFVMIAYSKGTTDAMQALVEYPEIHNRVLALISIAGVVNGTPIADSFAHLYGATLAKISTAYCPPTDGGEVASLARTRRLNWLLKHRLPDEIAYFSLVATPVPDRVSTILAPLHAQLSRIDPRNDSQVLHFDAIMPGSTLLGYANADHWAIALPFETEAPVLAGTLVNRNDFPRAQLLEAAVRLALEEVSNKSE